MTYRAHHELISMVEELWGNFPTRSAFWGFCKASVMTVRCALSYGGLIQLGTWRRRWMEIFILADEASPGKIGRCPLGGVKKFFFHYLAMSLGSFERRAREDRWRSCPPRHHLQGIPQFFPPDLQIIPSPLVFRSSIRSPDTSLNDIWVSYSGKFLPKGRNRCDDVT